MYLIIINSSLKNIHIKKSFIRDPCITILGLNGNTNFIIELNAGLSS